MGYHAYVEAHLVFELFDFCFTTTILSKCVIFRPLAFSTSKRPEKISLDSFMAKEADLVKTKSHSAYNTQRTARKLHLSI